MSVERGLSENLEAHLRKFIEPAPGQGRTPLQRQVKRVQEGVVDVEDGPLTDFVDCIIDLLNDLRLLVCCNKLVLEFAKEGNYLLSGRLKQICVVHGSNFKGCHFDQLLMKKLAEVNERELVVAADDGSYENLFELSHIYLNCL